VLQYNRLICLPVDWIGWHSTPAGSEVTGDPTGAKAPRRLQEHLPAESECPERKSTGPFA